MSALATARTLLTQVPEDLQDEVKAIIAKLTPVPSHWYADNPGYGEGYQLMSWTPRECFCSQPWTHSEPLPL